MLTRLKSTLSTVTSTLQAVRELPRAMKYIVEFARDNSTAADEVEFWKSARDRWMDWACHIDGGQRTPGTDDTYDGDMDMMSRISAAIEENSMLRDALESMNRLYDERCNSHVVENKNMWEAAAKSAKETVDLRTKLARYEAAEKWRQVTAGEGELPPPIPVLWRNNHPDFPKGELNYSIQGACGNYEWRFLSSKDVSKAKVSNE